MRSARLLLLAATLLLAGLRCAPDPALAHNTPPVPAHDVWNPGGCGVWWLASGNVAGQTTIANHRFWYWAPAAGPATYYTEGLIRERWAQAGYECGAMGRPRSNPAVAQGNGYVVVYQLFTGGSGCISVRLHNDGFIYGPVLSCIT